VSVVTRLWFTDMASSINGGDRDCPFAFAAREAVEPIQLYVTRIENFLHGVKRLESETDHSLHHECVFTTWCLDIGTASPANITTVFTIRRFVRS
jgi:hypothetical protein